MCEIIKVYKQTIPAMRFIGKKYGDASHWGDWFANGWFEIVENAMGGEDKAQGFYEDADAYIGLMREKEGEPFEYWIGEFTPAGTPVPEGFDFTDFPAATLGVCWIYGKEASVTGASGDCAKTLASKGMEITPDEHGAIWRFERYGCPRFTTPDEKDNVILDFCHFIK